ncbi:MAG: glycosyl hydrolase family 65 protein [Acetobacteraceae bacterium]|nr:glycosyl hydrolase family 65 protein [Acetobacteraceae bacterium]
MPFAFDLNSESGWSLSQDGVDPARERDFESRMTIANGLLATRGARDVGRAPGWMSATPSLTLLSWPRSYVAGLFDTPDLAPRVPVLMPVPDWTRLRLRVNGKVMLAEACTRSLDLRRSVLLNTAMTDDLHVRSLRFISQADRALAFQWVQMEVQRDCTLDVGAWFDTIHVGLEPIQFAANMGCWRTERGQTEVAMAAEASLTVDGQTVPSAEMGALRWSWQMAASAGQRICFERRVAVARDGDAQAALARSGIGWRAALEAHTAAWAQRWRCGDVQIAGDAEAQRAVRFAAHHLIASANPDDPTVSIGARGLSGDGYLGHVFWDTEIYMLPFFSLTWPQAAQALLRYRHRTLPGAKAKAASHGYSGAMYAWESADTGAEETPDFVVGADGLPAPVLCGKQEQHITADVAHAVWNHFLATGDGDFLRECGAEILIETARFWASRAILEPDGRHHIRGVIGPDEYHENIDDNAFTNTMARWNLQRAAEAVAVLRADWPQDAARLAVQDAELALWHHVADTLATGYDPDTGLLEQFDGFFARKPDPKRGRQDIKQADVVALLALLPDLLDEDDVATNFATYAPMASHESSLSLPMHALVAARLGEVGVALEYVRRAYATDLAGPAGSDAAGLHMAALGGIWQVAVLGFGGVSWRGERLHLNPRLPPGWTQLAFNLHWRGRLIAVRVTEQIEAELLSGPAMALVVGGTPQMLMPGRRLVASLPLR